MKNRNLKRVLSMLTAAIIFICFNTQVCIEMNGKSYIGIKNIHADTFTQTIVFEESSLQNRSKTVSVPGIKSVSSISVNTGSVTYTKSIDSITVNVSNGSPSRSVWNSQKFSKQGVGYLSNGTGTFGNTYNYSDNEGYTGILTKYGQPSVSSGQNTPPDTKTVTQNMGPYKADDINSGKITIPNSIRYDSGGYVGYLYNKGFVNPVLDPIKGWTTYVKYEGSVTRPAVETKVYTQEYRGTVYKGGYDNYYLYNVTLNYTKNIPTSITINAPINGSLFSETNNSFTPSVTVYDPDASNVLVQCFVDEETSPRGYLTLQQVNTPKTVSFPSVNISNLSEGKHYIKFYANDGYIVMPFQTSITLDKSMPTIKDVNYTVTTNSITISGSATDNVSGLDVNPYGYIIGNSMGDWTANTSCTNDKLIPNTSYMLVFIARDKVKHEASQKVFKYTLAEKPILTAVPQKTNSIELQVSDNNPTNTYYQIKCGQQYVNSNGVLTSQPMWITLQSKSIVLTGMQKGIAYNFEAKAKNGDGIETASSYANANVLNSKPVITIKTPVNKSMYSELHNKIIPSISVFDEDNDSISLKYKVDDHSEVVEPQIATNTSTSCNIDFTTPIDLSLLNEGNHKITFYSDDGSSIEQKETEILLDKSMPAIKDVNYTVTTNSITVSGSATDNISGLDANPYGYIIGNSMGDWTANTSCTNDKLTPNTSYMLVFIARDKVKHEASQKVFKYTLAEKPVLMAVPQMESAELNFEDKNPDYTEYQIKCGTDYVDSSGGLTSAPVWVRPTNKKITVVGLKPNTEYDFVAVAKNGDGIITKESDPLKVTTLMDKTIYIKTICPLASKVYAKTDTGVIPEIAIGSASVIELKCKYFIDEGSIPEEEKTLSTIIGERRLAFSKALDMNKLTEGQHLIRFVVVGLGVNIEEKVYFYAGKGENNDNKFDSDTDGEWEYYSNGKDGGKLYKREVNTKLDGIKLCDHNAAFIRILGDYVYYSNWSEDKQIYKVSKNNEQLHAEPVKVNDDASWYLNVVSPNLIYYSNWSDKGKIYKFDLTTGQKQNLNGNESAWILVTGNEVFYSNGNDKGKLYKLNIITRQEIKLSDDSCSHIYSKDGYIYYTNYSDSNKLYKVKPDGSGRQAY